MFARIFSLGIISSLFATVVSVVYTSFYTNVIVDFSEVASVVKILAYNVMIGTFASILFFGISKIITNKSIATFLFNLLLSGVSIALVFYVLKSNDPTFKNEDAELMKDFFKGFLMPMLFFPALSWFTFKPLIIK
ncbi:MAG: hypothetical protein RLZZ493_799 [Bacteroidota bacterium]|jgi:hypothetical protein